MKILARLLIVASLCLSGLAVAQQPAAPARPRITGISHVAFRVSDGAAARKFYGELIGLSERAGAGKGQVIFSVGGHQYVQLEPGLPANEEERLSHLAFATPDVKALAAHLTARGVHVSQPAERCADTAIRVTDPDGHPIEFMQTEWPPKPAAAASQVALSTRLLHAGLIIKGVAAAPRGSSVGSTCACLMGPTISSTCSSRPRRIAVSAARFTTCACAWTTFRRPGRRSAHAVPPWGGRCPASRTSAETAGGS